MHCAIIHALDTYSMHCTILQCTALQYNAIQCTALYYNALNCNTIYCTAKYSTTIPCTALYNSSLNSNTLHFTLQNTLHDTAAHCTEPWHFLPVKVPETKWM